MKISFDSLVFTTQRYGGVSRYIVSLATALMKGGHDIDFFGRFHINEYLSQNYPLAGNMIQLKKFPSKTRRIFQLYNDLSGYLSSRSNLPDVFHESFHHKRILIPKKIPIVVTVHDMIYEALKDDFPQHSMSTRIKKKSVDRADHVICISEQTKIDLIEYFNVPRNKISVIYHGSEWLSAPELLYINNQSIQNKDLYGNPYFLYVGSRKGYKNFRILLEAFSLGEFFKDFSLVCFGGGPLSSEELHLINSLKLPLHRIIVTGGSDIDLAILYRGAISFVYPSGYEGFGMPPLEAMSMGCPVIASNSAPMPEILGDAALFFDSQDSLNLVNCLNKITDVDTSEDFISKGYNKIKEYTWKKCALQTLEVYQKISS